MQFHLGLVCLVSLLIMANAAEPSRATTDISCAAPPLTVTRTLIVGKSILVSLLHVRDCPVYEIAQGHFHGVFGVVVQRFFAQECFRCDYCFPFHISLPE